MTNPVQGGIVDKIYTLCMYQVQNDAVSNSYLVTYQLSQGFMLAQEFELRGYIWLKGILKVTLGNPLKFLPFVHTRIQCPFEEALNCSIETEYFSIFFFILTERLFTKSMSSHSVTTYYVVAYKLLWIFIVWQVNFYRQCF